MKFEIFAWKISLTGLEMNSTCFPAPSNLDTTAMKTTAMGFGKLDEKVIF